MNEYPPGNYISDAMGTLPPAGPDSTLQSVEIDARPVWGLYRVTFKAKRNPRQRMGNHWFWTMEAGERLNLSE